MKGKPFAYQDVLGQSFASLRLREPSLSAEVLSKIEWALRLPDVSVHQCPRCVSYAGGRPSHE